MDYRSNSIKSRSNNVEATEAPPKKVEAVVTTSNVKEKSGFQKFFNRFISEDVDDIGDYILTNVLIPAGKKLIVDVVEGLVYPGGRRGDRSSSGPNIVSFRNYRAESEKKASTRPSNYSRSVLEYDDIWFESDENESSRYKAEKVLNKMYELVENYGLVSIADYYQLCGKHQYPFTYDNYGWYDLRNAEILPYGGGHYIKLPKVVSIV